MDAACLILLVVVVACWTLAWFAWTARRPRAAVK